MHISQAELICLHFGRPAGRPFSHELKKPNLDLRYRLRARQASLVLDFDSYLDIRGFERLPAF